MLFLKIYLNATKQRKIIQFTLFIGASDHPIIWKYNSIN